MRKRIVAILAAMGIIALGIAWFAGEESYVLDVKAKLSTALDVSPHGNWDLGTVYGQQKIDTPLVVHLSASAKADENLSSVAYVIGCNKPVPSGDGTAATGPVSICPYVELKDNDNNSVLTDPSTCVLVPGGPTLTKCNSFESGSIGLSLAENIDTAISPTVPTGGQPGHVWKIQINPPTCVSQKNLNKQTPVQGSCDQDTPLFMRGGIFVRLGTIERAVVKQPCDKKDPALFCLPDLTISIDSLEKTGTTCIVDFTVTNEGTHKVAVAGASVARISEAAGGSQDVNIPSLAPGASSSAQAIVSTPDGSCDITATADADDDVVEQSNSNNTDTESNIGG